MIVWYNVFTVNNKPHHKGRVNAMGKKIFKMTNKANKELKWYDDTRECQFIVYSPYFVYSFLDRQDAIESGCDLSMLELRPIGNCIGAFNKKQLDSGEVLKGMMRDSHEDYRQCYEMSHLKYVDNGKISNIYKGVDIEHTVVVREDYLPKDYKYHYTNVSIWKNPVLVQDGIYDMRWAYVLPINARCAIENLLKF